MNIGINMNDNNPGNILINQKIQHTEWLFTEWDKAHRLNNNPVVFLKTAEPLHQTVSEFDLYDFAGIDYADILISDKCREWLIFCEYNSAKTYRCQSLMNNYLNYSGGTDFFIYETLNHSELLMIAVMISRYGTPVPEIPEYRIQRNEPKYTEQRIALKQILTGDYPWRSLDFLKSHGIVDQIWPELASLYQVRHTKDYHPEGNGWKHSLETLKHRKKNTLLLSTALLLHDIGKPLAEHTNGRPFDRHAEIGAKTASELLRRLGFYEEFISRIHFLVRHHMLPSYLCRIPENKISHIMESPDFPVLLDLSYADLSSSYKDSENYYQACRVYKKFIKSKNRAPYLNRHSG